MKCLYEKDFPVPTPIDQNRHAIVMSLVWAYPMTSVSTIAHPEKVYIELINLIVWLAENGLIHGDFNEFNLMIDDEEKITLIDFPQMVSTDHQRAIEFFNWDINCIWIYFEWKYGLIHEVVPWLETDIEWIADLDKEMWASGFMKENLKDLDDLD